VRLTISDAHPGLVDAIASTLPGASWQRCRSHFLQNLLTRVEPDRDAARAIEMGESTQAVTTEHCVDGGTGVSEHRAEPVRTHLQLLASTHLRRASMRMATA
jgi:transposase-like protein